MEHQIVELRPYPDTRFGYCRCGCGERTAARTDRKRRRGEVGSPRNFIHSSHALRLKTVLRWEPQSNGCWLWRGKQYSDGYSGAVAWQGRKQDRAYRVMYQLRHGWDSIPPGMVLDHVCENRLCVNPDHLETVTSGENTRRGPRCNIQREELSEVRDKATEAGLIIKAVADEYEVDPITVLNAVLPGEVHGLFRGRKKGTVSV